MMLRSFPWRSASRAATLKSAHLGGVISAALASRMVDLPEPDGPTNRYPRSEMTKSETPGKVPQLKVWTRTNLNWSESAHGVISREGKSCASFITRPHARRLQVEVRQLIRHPPPHLG